MGCLGAFLGPRWAVLEPFWSYLGPKFGEKGGNVPSKALLAPTRGPRGGVLRLSWAVLWPSWGFFGCPRAVLEPSWGRLGTILGPSSGHLGPSWAILSNLKRKTRKCPKMQPLPHFWPILAFQMRARWGPNGPSWDQDASSSPLEAVLRQRYLARCGLRASRCDLEGVLEGSGPSWDRLGGVKVKKQRLSNPARRDALAPWKYDSTPFIFSLSDHIGI